MILDDFGTLPLRLASKGFRFEELFLIYCFARSDSLQNKSTRSIIIYSFEYFFLSFASSGRVQCGSRKKQFPLFIVAKLLPICYHFFGWCVWKLLLLCISLRAETRHKGFPQIKFHNSVCHTSNELFLSHNSHRNASKNISALWTTSTLFLRFYRLIGHNSTWLHFRLGVTIWNEKSGCVSVRSDQKCSLAVISAEAEVIRRQANNIVLWNLESYNKKEACELAKRMFHFSSNCALKSGNIFWWSCETHKFSKAGVIVNLKQAM